MRTFRKYASTAVFQQFSRDPITKEIPPPLLGTWIQILFTSGPFPVCFKSISSWAEQSVDP